MTKIAIIGAALVAVLSLPAAAQSLQDAVPDCKRGPRILKACRDECRRQMNSNFVIGMDIKHINDAYYICLDKQCWGIAKALEECNGGDGKVR